MIKLTIEDIFELKRLKQRLELEITNEITAAKSKVVREGSADLYRTSDHERDAERSHAVISRILAQA